LASVGGLVLGSGLVLGWQALDTAVRTVDQAEKVLRLPVLTAIPREKNVTKSLAQQGGALQVLRKPNGAVAEAFRSLRATLMLLGRASERKIFAVTSAMPGEGKTFTSCNLAVIFAQQGLKTILIDADLRRPAVEPLLFDTRDTAGLAELGSGQLPLDEVIRGTDVPNLSCITAGGRAPNPAELLGQEWFGELLKELARRFDRVVVDTAPVNAVSDTLVIVKYIQTVCLVVDSAKTPRKAIKRALEQLERSEAPIAGIVLNRLPPGGGIGYYYHYSSHKGYGRDGVYGAGTAAPAKA